MRSEFKQLASKIVWQLLLISLPFSSFPLLSKLFGGTSVAPLAMVFMVGIALLCVLPNLLREKGIPGQLVPILMFFFLAVVSTALAYFRQVPTFRDVSIFRNALEGFFTLLVGAGFYWAVVACVTDEKKLRPSLRWFNLGAVITMAFAFAQVLDWYVVKGYSNILSQIQSWISASGMLYPMRATGTAFEPSWLAHQLNMLYLPIWLGLSVQDKSAYDWRLFKKLTLENLLLAAGLIVLFLSFSRIGWLTTLAMVAFLIIRAANRLLDRFLDQKEIRSGRKLKRLTRLIYKTLLWMAVLLCLVVTLLLLGMLLTHIDPRMERLFDLERYRKFGILGWASQLSFAERLIYWISGFRVFLRHPFLGVGLGVSGYYFQDVVPEFGFKLPEIIGMLFFRDFIPNAKNLWVRLLAETGVVGFSVFIAWIYLHWRNAAAIEQKQSNDLISSFGLIGKLIILAMIMEGFSMDTFGLPYYWFALGLVTAVFRISLNERLLPDSLDVS